MTRVREHVNAATEVMGWMLPTLALMALLLGACRTGQTSCADLTKAIAADRTTVAHARQHTSAYNIAVQQLNDDRAAYRKAGCKP